MGSRPHPIVLDAEQRARLEAVVHQGRAPARDHAGAHLGRSRDQSAKRNNDM